MKTCLLMATFLHFDRAVYEELGKYGDLENQVLCRERVEELEPSIRYCLHKVGESNIKTSELVQIGEMEGPALDLFKAKLEVSLFHQVEVAYNIYLITASEAHPNLLKAECSVLIKFSILATLPIPWIVIDNLS